jgi:hypothetical protein
MTDERSRRRPSSTCPSFPYPPGPHNISHKLSISIRCSSGGSQEEGTINPRLAAGQLVDLKDGDPLIRSRCLDLCYQQ